MPITKYKTNLLTEQGQILNTNDTYKKYSALLTWTYSFDGNNIIK